MQRQFARTSVELFGVLRRQRLVVGDGVEEILIFQRGVPVLEDVDNQGVEDNGIPATGELVNRTTAEWRKPARMP